MPDDEAIWSRLLACARDYAGTHGSIAIAGGCRLWVAAAGSMPATESTNGSRACTDSTEPLAAKLTRHASNALTTTTLCYDPLTQSLRARRDPMGYRQLAWARVPGGVLLGTGEALLLAHPAIGRNLDQGYLAAYAAGLSPAHDATVWKDIRLLAAGETRVWHRARDEVSYERINPVNVWAGRDDAARASLLRDLLDDATHRAVGGARRIGVSLSAGLDSSALAASLSGMSAASAQRPLCVTYGFDHWPRLDERPAASWLAAHLGFEHVGVAADELRPLRPALRRPVCPDTPLQTPWREFKEASYAAFAVAGVDTVVSGNFGDHLWAHPKHWCAEALRDRAARVLWQGMAEIIRRDGWRGPWRDPGLRALARPWRLRNPALPGRLAMLAPAWREQLSDRLSDELGALRHWPRPEQAHLVFNAWASFDACGEDWYAHRHGLRIVQPYRDAQLTAAVLSLPAWESQRGPVAKSLLRRAMRGRLPDECLARGKVGDLTAYAEDADRREADEIRRLAGIAAPLIEPLLAADAASWTTPGDHAWMLASLGLWLECKGSRSPAQA